jgi:hypothetical protein
VQDSSDPRQTEGVPNRAAHQSPPPGADAPGGAESALARHRDPSLERARAAKGAGGGGRAAGGAPVVGGRRGIAWVRAGDLLTRGGTRLAGRGAAGQEAAVRRARAAAARLNPVSRRGIARRSAGSLPPPSAFGRLQPDPGSGRAVGR